MLCCLLLCGCGSEKSCEEIKAELTKLYNEFLNDIADLGAADILERCSAATQQCPGLPIAHELAGLVHWENGSMQEALACYEKALKLSPQDTALLTDAMFVAFEARRDYLTITDSGDVKTDALARLPLERYAQVPADIRLLWCADALGKWVRTGARRTVIKNRRGETIGETTIEFRTGLKQPQDLDYLLLAQSKAQPELILSRATGEQLRRYSSSEVTTELY